MIKALARRFQWRRHTGVLASLEDLARIKVDNATYVSCISRLTLLAPDIGDAIPGWRQPALVWPLSKSSKVALSNASSWLG